MQFMFFPRSVYLQDDREKFINVDYLIPCSSNYKLGLCLTCSDALLTKQLLLPLDYNGPYTAVNHVTTVTLHQHVSPSNNNAVTLGHFKQY